MQNNTLNRYMFDLRFISNDIDHRDITILNNSTFRYQLEKDKITLSIYLQKDNFINDKLASLSKIIGIEIGLLDFDGKTVIKTILMSIDIHHEISFELVQDDTRYSETDQPLYANFTLYLSDTPIYE